MVVSSTSMNVGITTATATTQGLIARRPAAAGESATLLMTRTASGSGARRSPPGHGGALRRGEDRLQEVAGVGAGGRLLVVDAGLDRQADEQRGPVRVVVGQLDADRQPLD